MIPPFPLFSYFSVAVCLRCLLHHILSLIVYTYRENRELVFVCLYITPSHYHHRAEFIWRHWNYKKPVRCNLSSVWVRLSVFSQLSIIKYVGMCVSSLPFPLWCLEIIYILCLIIIIKSEVWTITHCLRLGHETMVCAACLPIFLWDIRHQAA